MATTVQLDSIGGLELTEENGVITGAIRMAQLTNVGGAASLPAGLTLNEALIALDNNGAAVGSTFVINAQSSLILRNRTLQNIDEAARIFTARLEYEIAGSLGGGPGDTSQVTLASSVVQIETQLDRAGDQIIVSHNTGEQGGKLKVTTPQLVIVYPLTKSTSAPVAFVAKYLNKVNSILWNQADPGKWKCTAAKLEQITSGDPALWSMVFTFTLNPDGHQPQVVFIDPETGKPPPNLVADVGYKQIDWFDEVDFKTDFPQISVTPPP